MKYTGPMRFAHRGVVQAAPENTLEAFQAAVDAGYEGIEIDLRLSRDGEIIVAHDANFTRMTLGHPTAFSNRRLRDMDAKEICSLELPYANHMLDEALPQHSENENLAILPGRLMGQETGRDYETSLKAEPRMAHLARFSDFDKWLSGCRRKVTVEAEIKDGHIMKRMLEILDTSENVEHYIIFSGVEEYIEEIQNVCRAEGKPEELRLGANIRYLTEDMKNKIMRGNMDLYEVGLNAECFTREDVEWLLDWGIHTFSNLGDYPEWWEKLCGMDVMGFKTNYPGAFTRWWEQDHLKR